MDAEAPESEETTISVWAWIVGGVSWITLFMFSWGHALVDQPSPDRSGAFVVYMLAFMLGAGAIAAAVVTRGHRHVPLILGTVLAGAIGISTASVAETEYNALGIGLYYVFFLFPAIVLGYGITLAVLGIKNGKQGLADACITWGIGIGAGGGLAALYHLLTLSRQVRLAEEAHESPFGMVAVAMVLLLLAARRGSK